MNFLTQAGLLLFLMAQFETRLEKALPYTGFSLNLHSSAGCSHIRVRLEFIPVHGCEVGIKSHLFLGCFFNCKICLSAGGFRGVSYRTQKYGGRVGVVSNQPDL